MFPTSPHVVRYGYSAVLCAALACWGCGHSAATDEEAATEHAAKVVVKTSPVESRAIEVTVVGIGHTEALPKNLATLTPALEGHVREIRANVGDALQAGAVIVEFEATLAKADLAEKEATRDTVKAALDLLQAPPRPEDCLGLEIAIAQAAAATARSQTALDRLKPLRARGEVAEAQIYDADQAIVQARLQQRSTEAQLNLLLAGPRAEAVEEATSRLAAAEAAVALSRHRLELHFVRSPIEGVLDSLNCHPGQTIVAGSAIGEVVDTRQLNLVVWLPPQSVAEVKVGQIARVTAGVTAKATPGGPIVASTEEPHADAAISAKVVSIGQVVDPQTGSVPVRILLDNVQAQIAIGQTLSALIVVHEHVQELVIPATALVDLGEGALVLVVRDGKILPLHPTSVGTHGQWTVVTGADLKPGEQVVVEGGFNLPEGAAVATEPARQARTLQAEQ